jgi:hypothetical protein
MLWIGTNEGKDIRTIQYLVTSRWAKELDKTSRVNKVLYLDASMQWTQVAVDGKPEVRLRDQVASQYKAVRPHCISLRVCALKSPVSRCCEARDTAA